MSSPMKEWCEEREHQYVKANDLRDWLTWHYPDDVDYFDANAKTTARLDAKRELIDELMAWIDDTAAEM